MQYDDLLQLVAKRRSVRAFKSDPVPDEYIDKIIEVARWAPSGANTQPWEFVVIRDKKLKDKIVDILAEDEVTSHKMEMTREPELRHPGPANRKPGARPNYANAPVLILVCGDHRTKEGMTVNAIYNHGPDGLQHFASGLASAFLYIQLAATSLGLGSRWVSAVNNPLPQVQIKQLLGIPKEVMVYDMTPIGYPAPLPASEQRMRARRKAEEMTHRDGYEKAKYRTAEQIREFLKKVHGREGARLGGRR
ncbi:MAG: nitroreductase family protein [Dehalococcoidia bacterium]|nr:nitroreductase family protein [Dehalococcoidia bacterium]